MRYATRFMIGEREIALDRPSYFIADVAANHDGDLERAKDLIWRAKEAGADAVKFQHFLAHKIVSDLGFRQLGGQIAHQANWQKSVFEVYRQYSLNRDWDGPLVETARAAGIDWMTTPYDREATDAVAGLVAGLQDRLRRRHLARVDRAYRRARASPCCSPPAPRACTRSSRRSAAVLKHNPQLCLLQCNTNYTGSLENLRFVNLRVLQSYAVHWPGLPLGLSDHTPGHATVLGAIALGARVVEKHFTDDATRVGPDHGFSMTPATWREMVTRARELEAALGDGIKRIEENEREAAVVQRRCLRLARDLGAGAVIAARGSRRLAAGARGLARALRDWPRRRPAPARGQARRSGAALGRCRAGIRGGGMIEGRRHRPARRRAPRSRATARVAQPARVPPQFPRMCASSAWRSRSTGSSAPCWTIPRTHMFAIVERAGGRAHRRVRPVLHRLGQPHRRFLDLYRPSRASISTIITRPTPDALAAATASTSWVSTASGARSTASTRRSSACCRASASPSTAATARPIGPKARGTIRCSSAFSTASSPRDGTTSSGRHDERGHRPGALRRRRGCPARCCCRSERGPRLPSVLERCARIPGIDVVVCAVPDDRASDAVAEVARACGAVVFRGSERDVLDAL